jgi:hypothetical protein
VTTKSFSLTRRFFAWVAVSLAGAAPLCAQGVEATEQIPYQSVVNMSGKCTAQGATVCSFNFPTVPHGRRLVVRQISGLLNFSGAPDTVSVTISQHNGEPLQAFIAPALVYQETGFIQPTLFYVDADESFSVQVVALPFGQFAAGPAVQFMSATRYLIDCYRGSCPEVAH